MISAPKLKYDDALSNFAVNFNLRRYILEAKCEEYLILSGDHLYRMDYKPFIMQHRSSGRVLATPGARNKTGEAP